MRPRQARRPSLLPPSAPPCSTTTALWAEQPFYFQFAFALERIGKLVPQHPEWKTTEPFKSVLARDPKKPKPQ
jgi:hypothetical protein